MEEEGRRWNKREGKPMERREMGTGTKERNTRKDGRGQNRKEKEGRRGKEENRKKEKVGG